MLRHGIAGSCHSDVKSDTTVLGTVNFIRKEGALRIQLEP